MLKKGVIFFGWTNSEVLIFWGIKYEPLSDPPSLKFVSGDLSHTMFVCVCVCVACGGGRGGYEISKSFPSKHIFNTHY